MIEENKKIYLSIYLSIYLFRSLHDKEKHLLMEENKKLATDLERSVEVKFINLFSNKPFLDLLLHIFSYTYIGYFFILV